MPSHGRHRGYPGAARVAEILQPQVAAAELLLTIGPEQNTTGWTPSVGNTVGSPLFRAYSSTAERESSKLAMRVRFPLGALAERIISPGVV